MAATNVHTIPSLHQPNPAPPAAGGLDINNVIIADTPIDPANLTNDKLVAKKLQTTLDSRLNPGITDDMFQAAEFRVGAVEGTATYTPGLTKALAAIFRRLEAIESRLSTMEGRLECDINTLKKDVQLNNAMILNHQIIARNMYNLPECEPLRKTVAGHDYDHLEALTSHDDRRGLARPDPHAPPAAIGSIPPNFERAIYSYTSIDISRLILFYNEDFGIVLTDNVAARRMKLIYFLSRFYGTYNLHMM